MLIKLIKVLKSFRNKCSRAMTTIKIKVFNFLYIRFIINLYPKRKIIITKYKSIPLKLNLKDQQLKQQQP